MMRDGRCSVCRRQDGQTSASEGHHDACGSEGRCGACGHRDGQGGAFGCLEGHHGAFARREEEATLWLSRRLWPPWR